MNDSTSSGLIHLNIETISAELKIRPEIYLRIVTSFVNNMQGKMALLEEALAGKDFSQMRSILHEIKGTAGNLRLDPIIEPEAVMHDAVKAQESHDKLEEYFSILKVASDKLTKYVLGLSSSSE